MSTCNACQSPTCPHCGKALTCVQHCYCQHVTVGSRDHVVCCKCGDRVVAAGQPWVSPVPFIPCSPLPYNPWPIYPQPTITTWPPFTVISTSTSTVGRYDTNTEGPSTYYESA